MPIHVLVNPMSSARDDNRSTPRVRPRWRARAAGESGDTMIEVIVAALLVALIAAGVLTGFGQVGSLSAQQRQRAQATALAQQDQARLRGLAITQLSSAQGNLANQPFHARWHDLLGHLEEPVRLWDRGCHLYGGYSRAPRPTRSRSPPA